MWEGNKVRIQGKVAASAASANNTSTAAGRWGRLLWDRGMPSGKLGRCSWHHPGPTRPAEGLNIGWAAIYRSWGSFGLLITCSRDGR